MKKLLLLLCMTHPALAAHDFAGFYVKGGVGATLAQYEVEQQLTSEMIGFITLTHPSHLELNASSPAGLLGVGYTYAFNSRFILSAEFTAGLTHAQDSHHLEFVVPNASTGNPPIIFDSQVKTTLKNDFALLVKPGFTIKEKTQFYILLGPRWGNFDTSAESQFDFQSLWIGSGSDSTSDYKLGFTAGLGVERLLTDHITLGLEYAYTHFGEIASPNANYITNEFSGIIGVITDDVDIDTNSSSLMLDLTYRL